MDKPTFLLVGGFLGAGKTTALARLAARFRGEGLRVGLITNDQAEHLVDTGALREDGHPVEEVAGACFCCKFDDLGRCAQRLRDGEDPDVLLGEPVGSCTDLAATVLRPLRQRSADLYAVGPYSVLVDPARARRIVVERENGGFSEKVAYIYRKQLEEADLICLNKVDAIRAAEREALLGALAGGFPAARVLAVSAATGEGFDRWVSCLRGAGVAGGSRVIEVDYDTYAAGEADLGWLNANYAIEAPRPFDPNDLLLELVRAIARGAGERGAEGAHVKALLATPRGIAVANWTGAGSPPALSRRAEGIATSGELILNARVHVDPNILAVLAESALRGTLDPRRASARALDSQHFRPGRPIPTYRLEAGSAE
jgi:Ni2+-binding GTPase involved in maturation of urease and hydrogenase